MSQDKLFQLLLVKFNDLQKQHDSLSELMISLSDQHKSLKEDCDYQKELVEKLSKAFLSQHKIYDDTRSATSTEIAKLHSNIQTLTAKIEEAPPNNLQPIPIAAHKTHSSTNTDYMPTDTSKPPPNFGPPHFYKQNFFHFKHFRPRLCYNCRSQGHLAKDCHKPNSRNQNLSAPTPTSTALSEPTSPTLSESLPPPAKTMSLSSKFSVQHIPVFSKNPLLRGLDMSNRICTPYGSEADL